MTDIRNMSVSMQRRAAKSQAQSDEHAAIVGPRFTLEAGRHVTDTLTGDQFNLDGCLDTSDTAARGNLKYNPCRLDDMARRVVALLNAHGVA